MTTLGSGINRASIYDRSGVTRLLDLPDTMAVSWERVLNDVSQAGVTVPVPSGSAARAKCCGEYGKVHTWNATLVVHRDGERVWEGPVIRVTHTADAMDLIAWDVLGWTKKRRVHTNRVIGSSPVVTEALLSLTRAFNPDDPNVAAHILNPDPAKVGRNTQREVLVDSAYYWDDLSALTDTGVRLTTVGRRIIVAAANCRIGRTALLLPDNHLIADVQVIEDGEMLATAVSTRDDKGHSAYVAGTPAVDAYYGLVESILSNGGGTSNSTALANQATSEREDHYPAPLLLNIPDNARLRPDAPFPMSHLVCGTQVPVHSTATCVEVKSTMILNSLSVKQDADGVEEVGITLQPVSTAAVSTELHGVPLEGDVAI